MGCPAEKTKGIKRDGGRRSRSCGQGRLCSGATPGSTWQGASCCPREARESPRIAVRSGSSAPRCCMLHTSPGTTPPRYRSCRKAQARSASSTLLDAYGFRYCHRTSPPRLDCLFPRTCTPCSCPLLAPRTPTPPPSAYGTSFLSLRSVS